MKSQKEAVYSATMSVLTEAGIELEGSILDVITKDMRESIQTIVCQAFQNGEVEFRDTAANKAKLTEHSKLSQYVVGLVNNWFRKDKRLNGGVTYTAKNPGSRVSDPTLKALKALLKLHAGTDKAAMIQAEIDKRTAEHQASKQKEVEVDYSLIPADLKETLGIE